MLSDIVIGKVYSYLDAGGSPFSFISVLGFFWYFLAYENLVDIHYINFSSLWSSLFVPYQRLSYNLVELENKKKHQGSLIKDHVCIWGENASKFWTYAFWGRKSWRSKKWAVKSEHNVREGIQVGR